MLSFGTRFELREMEVKAMIKLKVKTDTLTGITLPFKKDKKDAGVLYNPSRKAPKDLQMHTTDLGNVELKQSAM